MAHSSMFIKPTIRTMIMSSDRAITSYKATLYVCTYPHNITDIIPLHVAHLPLLSSLFVVGLCIPKGTLQYFPTDVHKNLNTIDQLAIISKQPKNYALRLRFYYTSQALATYVP